MARANKVLSYTFTDASNYDNPIMATSQHKRETKPWYVCPRTPWTHGFVFDAAPFLNYSKRRLGDNPGGMVQAAFIMGYGYGIGYCIKDLGIERYGMTAARQQNVRLGHEWAMKRLAFVWVMRPALLASSIVAAYAFPKELFQQNFNRKNKRGFYDPLPHFVGLATMFPVAKVMMGTVAARYLFGWGLFWGGFYDLNHYMGHNIWNYQRDLIYPQIMSNLYGLPNGGEGFDGFVDGEHAKQWRLESFTESLWLPGKHKIANSHKYDDHPKMKQEWGHASYFG
eukprot:TRINITY_DN42403_c0_g1_i1.p1 TRINITY_DN42403_c0_g1~~TRINITY_DN42403_c0_g1_i1.p1  ORF type:complete len:294 (+),score=45.01 TRINITY_DN42403_c0_g1_i1:37-882(+)